MQEQPEQNLEKHFSEFDDAALDAFLRTGFNNAIAYTAALRVFHRRKLARENALHAELLAEIKRPHWSITPGFLVGVVAMIAACIAAYPVLFSQSQAQQSIVVTQPSSQIIQPAIGTHSKSPQQPSNSNALQSQQFKR